MTTPFDQQPQPVPPSEGTNDAPEDRANAPTVPNTVPAGQPNVASDGATTTPMTPATASQQPAGAPFDRVYAVSPQQLFQVIHDQLTTGATFTLDNENTQTGAFSFHSYDGVNCMLTVVRQGPPFVWRRPGTKAPSVLVSSSPLWTSVLVWLLHLPHMVPVLPLVLLVPLRLPCLLRMHKG